MGITRKMKNKIYALQPLEQGVPKIQAPWLYLRRVLIL
jgi:hypothetical protein